MTPIEQLARAIELRLHVVSALAAETTPDSFERWHELWRRSPHNPDNGAC